MNLRSKLIYAPAMLIIVPLLIFGYVFDYQIKNITLKDKIESINIVLDQNIDSALELIDRYKAITLLTSLYPPIQGIIRSKDTGTDPLDGSTVEDWKR